MFFCASHKRYWTSPVQRCKFELVEDNSYFHLIHNTPANAVTIRHLKCFTLRFSNDIFLQCVWFCNYLQYYIVTRVTAFSATSYFLDKKNLRASTLILHLSHVQPFSKFLQPDYKGLWVFWPDYSWPLHHQFTSWCRIVWTHWHTIRALIFCGSKKYEEMSSCLFECTWCIKTNFTL